MLKVKYLTLFKQKNWKKAGILTKVARKIQLCWIFFATQGANPNIKRVMAVFSPQPLKKWFF